MVAQHGLRFELRLSLPKLRLILILLDGEEEVALLYDRAVLEMDLLEITRHARDELHLTDRLRIAGERQRLAHRLHLRQDDRDRRRVGRLRGRGPSGGRRIGRRCGRGVASLAWRRSGRLLPAPEVMPQTLGLVFRAGGAPRSRARKD